MTIAQRDDALKQDDGRFGSADRASAHVALRRTLRFLFQRSMPALGLVTCLIVTDARAQEIPTNNQLEQTSYADSESPSRERRAWDDLSPGRHTAAIMIGTSVALAVYGKRKWWQDGFRGRFTAVNEGWFGQETYSGGADKLGHFYMTYASSRLLTRAFIWDGAPEEQSLKIAAWYTLGAFAAIEVADGFSKKWRFSREDMLMNVAGVGAGVLLERHPDLDRRFDLRVLYRPSREEGRRFDPFGDYSGQTYLIVTKLAGFPALRRHGLLRYVEVAAGYGTRGYEHGSGIQGTRNVYLGLSLNLSELINQRGAQGGRLQRSANTALEFVQIPGTVLLSRHTLRPGPPPHPKQDGL